MAVAEGTSSASGKRTGRNACSTSTSARARSLSPGGRPARHRSLQRKGRRPPLGPEHRRQPASGRAARYANCLAFGPRGERLFAAVDNHSLRCWDTASGKQLWMNDHWASNIAVSPDGKVLAADSTWAAGPSPSGRRPAATGSGGWAGKGRSLRPGILPRRDHPRAGIWRGGVRPGMKGRTQRHAP